MYDPVIVVSKSIYGRANGPEPGICQGGILTPLLDLTQSIFTRECLLEKTIRQLFYRIIHTICSIHYIPASANVNFDTNCTP